jgi:hypothetical protein
MIKAYIAHPLRGPAPHTEEKIRENIELVSSICRDISSGPTKVIPFSPIHAFAYMDPLKYDQDMAMRHCLELLSTCDELWVFGDWETSTGCRMEVEYAKRTDIPIRFLDNPWEGIAGCL